ncbi:hypothetical protein ABF179_002269 [Flavobacterium psychrophilum]
MIVAIERSKFIYLYKYNEISIDANQVIDLSVEKIIDSCKENNHKLIEDFNRILPIFEQDHEVILLEIDKKDISIQGKLNIYFKAVLSIYPLTNIGSQLLQGKINDNFIIKEPIFEEIIEEVKIIRSLDNRNKATENILNSFLLNITNVKKSLLEESLKRILLSKNSNDNFNSFLDYLISYNKTPSNIPDGNVEFLCKIGIIVLNYLKIDEANFFKGPYYKSCLNYRDEINDGSIFNSYSTFIEIKDSDLISSLESLKSKIDITIPGIDIFKASYFFLAYKAYLNKNDKNLELLKNEIEQLKFDDEQTTAFVLAMIGYVFSFESLYESLHTINKAPLIKISSDLSFMKKSLVITSINKLKKTEDKIVKKIKSSENGGNKDMVSEEVSVPIIVYESNLNNVNTDKTDLTLFTENDKSLDENTNNFGDEVTKSVPELLNWINNHKPISKSATFEWKKFIEKFPNYATLSLIDISSKVKNEKLEKKLTAKMLIDLEKFFSKKQ